MVLQYKVEFRDQSGEGLSALIHTVQDHGIASEYVDHTSKTEWTSFTQENDTFTSPVLYEALLGINGVVKAGVYAHRVYLTRSPAVPWDNVVNSAVSVLQSFYNEGSAEAIKGSGMQLAQGTRRRALDVNRYRMEPFGTRSRSVCTTPEEREMCPPS